jgi:release factor glutamine methyltransferase
MEPTIGLGATLRIPAEASSRHRCIYSSSLVIKDILKKFHTFESMDETEIKIRNAFHQTLAKIALIYHEPEATSLMELVFRHLLNSSRFELYQKFDTNLSNSQQISLNEIVFELQNHKPLQYILGETEFYGLIFKVGPGILIPRQETEELVAWIISDNDSNTHSRMLDIGTGSGCIAVSLAKNLPFALIDAIDVSDKALSYAHENALLNSCSINFQNEDIFKFIPEEIPVYDSIISNPPYVPESDKNYMQPNVLDYEPGLALFVPDNDPLIFYQKILEYALLAGKPAGKVYFEIHEKFGEEIRQLLSLKGFENIIIRKDIHGKDRMASGQIPLKI